MMLSKIRETKRRFSDYAADLSNSDAHTFENALNILLGFCESDDVMTMITGPLKENVSVDILKWYEDFSSSGGSFVGSGRFLLPTKEDDRLSLLYQLLLKVRSDEIPFDSFCRHAFGGRNMSETIHRFNDAVSRPLARGLLQKVEALEVEGSQKTPTIEGTAYTFVLSKLESLEWKGAKRELDRSLGAFDDGRMADCSNNLRMGLMTILCNIYEALEGKSAPAQPGKTTDISTLARGLGEHGYAEDALGLIRQIWSFVSERAHIDKRSGQPPSEHDVNYGLQITFSAIEYLLREFERSTKPKTG